MPVKIDDKKFLITGAGGQLAQEFISFFEKHKINYVALRKNQLDITDGDRAAAVVARYKPDILINGAAYNLVDRAEEEPQKAFKINSDGVRHLAAACRRHHIFLVHFSSDYVFDGQKGCPYTEDDRTNPLNIYGQSKLKGEKALHEELEKFMILRLSWVFGSGQQNFLRKLRQWAKGRKELQVVNDEISVPTFTEDVVQVVLPALEQGLTGLFHVTNNGRCSRYEWAKYYFEKEGTGVDVRPVLSGHFPAKAKRPLWTVMSNKKVCDALNIRIPTWQNAVDRVVVRERANEFQMRHNK
jgi:dTDP-4-dehydrorhamnose reductase